MMRTTPPKELAPNKSAPAVTNENSRVHHEYFVGEQRSDRRFPWLCRVYAKNGAVNESRGDADSHDSARKAAIKYADATKRALGGEK